MADTPSDSTDAPTDTTDLGAVVRLSRDLKKAAQTLSPGEARFLVDSFYQMQGDRIRSTNQVRTLVASEEPHQTIAWLADQAGVLERSIMTALDAYNRSSPLGLWARSICGIGPVITAGLLAHIDITKAPTAGHIWRFAGLDPTVTWEKGQKRPWNASLKTLCWKIGESFVKVSSNDDDFYGHLYVERKAFEQKRNESGALAEQATAKLARFKIGKDTDAYAWYSGSLTLQDAAKIAAAPSEKRIGLAKKLAGAPGSGMPMLPPAHVHARAKRWTVKLFLAHYQAIAYRVHYNAEPPKPYILTQAGGHAHEIQPPNWPMKK
jgi:hypothetical protein